MFLKLFTDETTSQKVRLNSQQVEFLENEFAVNMYPNNCTILHLATQLGLNRKRIISWFASKRVKLKEKECKGIH